MLQEILYTMQNKCGKGGLIGIKVEMHKASNRVKWNVLCHFLCALGFFSRLVGLVLQCISITSSKLLLNGKICGRIEVSRGLKWGSPFLFIILSKLSSRLSHHSRFNGEFYGIHIARGAFPIDHLLFVDGLLLFYKANCKKVINLQNYLDLYCS